MNHETGWQMPADMKVARHYIFPEESIQWHLTRTTYDRCPKCGGKMAYLGVDRRACWGTCEGSPVWSATLTGLGFVRQMYNQGTPRQLIKGIHVCKACGGLGHQARACPSKS